MGREVLSDGSFPADPNLSATHARPYDGASGGAPRPAIALDPAIQGIVSRAGEVLLLAFDAQEEGAGRNVSERRR
jgi:hypothetical protein